MKRTVLVLIVLGVVLLAPAIVQWFQGPMSWHEAHTRATYALLAGWWVRAALRHPEP